MDRVELGRTGLKASRIGLGASYGLEVADVEHAFERGINYFYWGALPRPAFGRGVKALAKQHRDDMVIVVQGAPATELVRARVDWHRSRLGVDQIDFLLYGWQDRPPSRRKLDIARRLKDEGKIKHLMVSSHVRPIFEQFIAQPADYDAIMVRYNAAHRGAEHEVFPHLPETSRPGVVAYTATRWGALIDPAHTPDGEATPRASDCYRFTWTNDDVDICLSGPKNRAEVDEALAALERGPMTPDEVAWMQRVGDHIHEQLPTSSGPAQMWGRFAEAFLRS